MFALIVVTIRQGAVVDVRPFGCFLEFDVEAEGGDKHKVYGMVHVSEMSWEYCEDARSLVKVLFFTTICASTHGINKCHPAIPKFPGRFSVVSHALMQSTSLSLSPC